uniref:Peptidase M10 metallopeptidase domain-containing protein n=1 Tax=Panagrolaimus davidi TaxID=227884 RepID=A0A914P8N3_9BILA
MLLSLLLLGFVEIIHGAPISNANPWDKKNVTYTIIDDPMNLSPVEIRPILSKAFNTWSSVIPLNFIEVEQNSTTKADIEVIFTSSEGNPLFADRSGFVIPYKTIYLFTDSPRTINIIGQNVDQIQTDFYYEALYNVGKVLGLRDSRNKNSMMYTGYTTPVDSSGNYIEPKLSAEDIKAAQKIYGQRK